MQEQNAAITDALKESVQAPEKKVDPTLIKAVRVYVQLDEKDGFTQHFDHYTGRIKKNKINMKRTAHGKSSADARDLPVDALGKIYGYNVTENASVLSAYGWSTEDGYGEMVVKISAGLLELATSMHNNTFKLIQKANEKITKVEPAE